ncbi:uncharacterized protein LOC121253403 [Juglans microcarpa x Juglans regia]|uniref:uncharacterized protein LOC121253403 n=1 Tax=Juglans microcarpa x Juglans regia TaxID=2249226 RepID=UPI001B7DFA8F|nr:uncharacterized protein LOC121253403 [Juglans microcarpa x Juglans regia]
MSLQLFAIKTLTGTNYKDWYEFLTINLAIMNLDLTMRVDASTQLIEESFTEEEFLYESWEHSNRTCLMIVRYTIDKFIRQSIANTENANGFLEVVGKKFTKFDKVENGTYIKLLTTTTYDGLGRVREHIMKLTHFFNKLKEMKVELQTLFLCGKCLSLYRLNLMDLRPQIMLRRKNGA